MLECGRTCWNSCEMTCWKRSTTSGLGGGGPCWQTTSPLTFLRVQFLSVSFSLHHTWQLLLHNELHA